MNIRQFFEEGEKFDWFDETIDEMFQDDDSLKGRRVEVLNKEQAQTPASECYTRGELDEFNKGVKYKYSNSSLSKLEKIKKPLVDIFMDAANHVNIRIVYGYRTAAEQYDLFLQGRSHKDGYEKLSKHQLGEAVDSVPVHRGVNMYKGTKENELRWAYYNGLLKGIAVEKGIRTRSGWKWRESAQDAIFRPMGDNTLPDYNHIEII